MKFKVDENLPGEFAELLRAAGFAADTVGEERLSGARDSEVLERSHTEDRALVTLDLDFSNIQAYPPASTPGIVVIRTKTQDKLILLSLLRRLIQVLGTRSPSGQLWIVESDRIRFRDG